MTWKKIICKKVEELPLLENQRIDSHRKFETFDEIFFHNAKQTRPHETHTDMGEFYRYLVQHNCEYIFKDYFGIEGKSPVS